MHTPPPTDHLIRDELALLASLVPLDGAALIELGCGAADLARRLVAAHPGASVLGLEVDERQMAKNLAQPEGTWAGIRFAQAGAQAIPAPDASFDGALMLKSLHHVPLEWLDQALAEVHRVLKPGGWLYVSEPVFDGLANEVIKLFNDEGVVRREAYQALMRALARGPEQGWEMVTERFFEMPTRYRDFADFAARMIDVTYAERRLDGAIREEVRARFERLGRRGEDGYQHFTRAMRINLLRRLP
ncbi:class I SAM-dependent methyltransferase [Sphaerotilus microaerophilus]|uniref:Ubiquinone/menaquinone biosynthesis methyltransferase n=1 Tax=Sphaerotilus microaerophilus TaxID=2914710 RepID=A0ABM7YMN8_9BURK|nr:class I SAM-dependent methyltransferase [Sphaerotilus sp. FB-5]BDI05726.1 ubiquinone/menaquinone biosynthesis methyltransferase [Sphaerotilus sp. FB-5]